MLVIDEFSLESHLVLNSMSPSLNSHLCHVSCDPACVQVFEFVAIAMSLLNDLAPGIVMAMLAMR